MRRSGRFADPRPPRKLTSPMGSVFHSDSKNIKTDKKIACKSGQIAKNVKSGRFADPQPPRSVFTLIYSFLCYKNKIKRTDKKIGRESCHIKAKSA